MLSITNKEWRHIEVQEYMLTKYNEQTRVIKIKINK